MGNEFENLLFDTYMCWFRQRKLLMKLGPFLVVQWLKNPPANAGNMDSVSGVGRFHMPRGHYVP